MGSGHEFYFALRGFKARAQISRGRLSAPIVVLLFKQSNYSAYNIIDVARRFNNFEVWMGARSDNR